MNPHIHLQQGDITKLNVDAIVNAANTSLLGGGGVDGAIHRAGGPAILQECQDIRNRQGGCKVGEAVITTGGNLPARFVIHTVGPVWNGGRNNEEQLLADAYRNSLELAVNKGIRTIAFPNISTGIYHFPKDKAAEIALHTTDDFLKTDPEAFDKVIFVCFDQENYQLYQAVLNNSPLNI
jgi:O-acetyl-ADP-ribose deacetylase (regulator of RNase III)